VRHDRPTPFSLDDDQRRRISQIVKLGPGWPIELENILGRARWLATLDADLTAPSDTKRSLRALSERTAGLRDTLRNAPPDVLGAIVAPDHIARGDFLLPPRMMRHRAFEEKLEALDSLAKMLTAAISELDDGDRGDKTSAAHFTARGIDELLARHGHKRLTPTYRRGPDPGRDLLQECFTLLKIEIDTQSVIKPLAAERNAKRAAWLELFM
jgi:hypothetical protein